MECPHCSADTDPTLLYCKNCGEQIELDPEQVRKSIERDEEVLAVEHLEEKTKVGLYLAAFVLVVVIAFRIVVVRRVEGEVNPGYFAPARVVEDKAAEPPASVELPVAPIEIPTEKEDKK